MQSKRDKFLEKMISFYNFFQNKKQVWIIIVNLYLLSYPFLHNASKKILFLLIIRLLRVYRTRIMIESCNGLMQQSLLYRRNFILSQTLYTKQSINWIFFMIVKKSRIFTREEVSMIIHICTFSVHKHIFSLQTHKYWCILRCLIILDFQYSLWETYFQWIKGKSYLETE